MQGLCPFIHFDLFGDHTGMKSQSRYDYANKEHIKKLMLSKKFRQYFFPSLIAAVAMSLSEFVDSMVVSNLMGSNALAIVSVCTPLMTIMAAIFMLLGGGGAICYTEALGRRDPKGADRIFTATLVTAFAASIVLMAAGQMLIRPLANLLCPGMVLGEELIAYMHTLLFSMPFLICVSLVLMYLPSAGSPKLSMTLNIFANVLNLCLDAVYIRLLGLGVNGAACATLTSYVISGIVTAVLFQRLNLKFRKPDFGCLGHVVKCGMAGCLSQIGFSLKFGFCNNKVSVLGGANALVAMSLCFQTVSIISIVVSGAVDTVRPLVSFLRSQQDYKGVRYMLVKTLRLIFGVSALFTIWLLFAPQSISAMFNVTDSETLAFVLPALRIFSLTYLLRSVIVVFMLYTSIIERTGYSMYISLFDGFVGIITIGMVMSRLYGVYGIWWTFPIDSLLLFISIIIINNYLLHKYPDRYEDILLSEKIPANVHLMDISLAIENGEISDLSQGVIDFCTKYGADTRTATLVGLCAEEMAVYTRQHRSEWLNLMLKVDEAHAILDFRSLGTPFDLCTISEEDIDANFKVLRGITQEYEYSNSLGMNCTRFAFPLHA